MADNNRLELEITATDTTGSATAKARANFKSVEQDAAKAAENMSKGFDAASVNMAQKINAATEQGMRSLEALARRAELAGKSAMEKLYYQRNNIPTNLGDDPRLIAQYQSYYDKLIAVRRKYDEDMKKMDGHGEGGVGSMVLRRGFLAVKDFSEGRVQGTTAEVADILFGQGGTGGVVQKFIPQIAEITGLSNGAVIAVGSLAGAFLGLGIAGLESVKSLAETGEQINNFSLRSGIDPTRVQAYQFAAKAAGQDPNTVERLSRELSRAADDHSQEGRARRDYLQNKLGVNLFDDIGSLKPTEQIFLDIADGINKLPPGLERSAAMVKIFGENGAQALPIFEKLRENIKKSDEMGNTFTESDLKLFEEWKRQLVVMDTEWERFKARIMTNLAVTVTATLHLVNESLSGTEKQARVYGSPYASVLEPGINDALAARGLFANQSPARPKPPGQPTGLSAYEIALEKRGEADALIAKRYQSDPEARQRDLERQMTEIGVPIKGRTSLYQAQKYYALQDQLKGLKPDKSGAEGLVAAAKENQQLLAQSADIKEAALLKQLSADDGGKGLVSESDWTSAMEAAKQKAIADENKFINERRYKIDDKTGRKIDLSNTQSFQQFLDAANANLPQRIENEQTQVQSKFDDREARYLREQRNSIFEGPEKERQAREQAARSAAADIDRLTTSSRERSYGIAATEIEREKNLAIQSLGVVNAQSLQEKEQLEDRRFAIESFYAQKSTALQIQKLENERNLQLSQIETNALRDPNNRYIYDQEAQQVRQNADEQIAAARQGLDDKLQLSSIEAVNKKAQFEIESNRKVYDSLKQDAAGLFDQLVFHTKSWGDFAKDLFKATILTPIKEIFSSQVAALFTKGLTGSDVSFGDVGNGQGALGRVGGLLGRAGLGPPRFGAQQPHKLEQPGHLGDLSLVSGAVPVVLMNAGGGGPARASSGGGFSFGSLAAGIGLGGLFSGGAVAGTQGVRSPIESATAKILSGAIDGTIPGSDPLGGLGYSLSDSPWTNALSASLSSSGAGTGSSGGFLGKIGSFLGLGGGGSVGGTPPFLPGGASGSSGSGGILGSILGGGGSPGGGILGKLGGLFGQGSAGTDIGGGIGIANTGILGHLAAFGKSGGAALLGGGIALDGIRRGGVLGTLEAAGGGALVGFKYGGPIGAVIGAAIGGGIAAGKSIFGTTDRQHAKDLVKQVYGMDVNNGIADQIVAIAKQSFGNQIDVAVRSPQVRDLLKLYAQTTGQKKAEDQFVQSQVHSASFVESGGSLQQQAIYDNGNAYAYSSPLATYGGVTTAPLSTFAPNQGVFNGNLQIQLNGQSASDALAGQVVRVATPSFVQGQSLSAASSSVGRTSQQNMVLSPSAIAR